MISNMEGQNIDAIENVDLRENSHYDFHENDSGFIYEVSEMAQKKKSTMKTFCEQTNIEDEKCEEIAEYGRIHKEANTFNSTSMMTFEKIKADEQIEACSCGCRKGVGQYLSIWMNEQNLTFLGPGILLFFFFLKHVRMTLVLLLMSYGTFALITNIISEPNVDFSVCIEKQNILEELLCKLNFISTFNLKTSKVLRNFQLWMGFFLSIVWFFSLSFINYLGERKDREIDEFLDSASDYTVRIQNLPFGEYNEKELIEYINELWETRKVITQENFDQQYIQDKVDLKSIQIIYDMSECRRLINKIQILSLQINKIIEDNETIKDRVLIQFYKRKKRQLMLTFQQIEELRIKFTENEQFRRELSTTCTLIEFKDSEQQKQFLEIYGKKESNILKDICEEKNKQTFLGKEIIFARAPEPSDFNWSNCEIRFSYCRYFMIWSIIIVILLLAYAMISYLQTTDFVKNSVSFLISIILQVFNRIIWLSLSYLVTFQYNNTKTESIVSLMKKSIFAQVLNVIVTPVVNMFVNNKPLFGDGSLSIMVLNYQFIMFFMMFVFYVLNPTYYLKKIIICIPQFRNLMVKRLCEVVGQIDTINQIRPVLTYYEGPQFPIAGAYVYMTTAIFHTLFYCHIQPVLLFIVIFNLTGFYLILKYLLFRRCKIPELTDVQIFKLAVSVLRYGCLFFGAGSLFFIIIEKYDGTSNNIVINPIELIPSSLALITNFILFLNPFEINQKVNKILFYVFTFNKDFTKSKQMVPVKELMADIFLNNLENKVSYERKQSYYKNSNLHKLFNFESELKQIANQKSVQRSRALQFFCQSFFNEKPRSLKHLTNRKSFNMNEDLMEMILIPALQIHKTKKTINIKQNTIIEKKRNSGTQDENFTKAQQIISKLFGK